MFSTIMRVSVEELPYTHKRRLTRRGTSSDIKNRALSCRAEEECLEQPEDTTDKSRGKIEGRGTHHVLPVEDRVLPLPHRRDEPSHLLPVELHVRVLGDPDRVERIARQGPARVGGGGGRGPVGGGGEALGRRRREAYAPPGRDEGRTVRPVERRGGSRLVVAVVCGPPPRPSDPRDPRDMGPSARSPQSGSPS
ncbi:hypothetical protein THAOC_26045 [Thalassiosira oceanica]|uniref:Uncharacterized protein n=1 Tax=Thalassiosira oceanica TaxID=159749 RepID=K0S637_THAOC|nr:hypothetical protein THAOC_26045 [Thalassiosira oceanica]|eukprot:EJK54337.1 hypothetical protein THAOC_26045 [Thalassiosira oceanica]